MRRWLPIHTSGSSIPAAVDFPREYPCSPRRAGDLEGFSALCSDVPSGHHGPTSPPSPWLGGFSPRQWPGASPCPVLAVPPLAVFHRLGSSPLPCSGMEAGGQGGTHSCCLCFCPERERHPASLPLTVSKQHLLLVTSSPSESSQPKASLSSSVSGCSVGTNALCP